MKLITVEINTALIYAYIHKVKYFFRRKRAYKGHVYWLYINGDNAPPPYKEFKKDFNLVYYGWGVYKYKTLRKLKMTPVDNHFKSK